MEVAPDEVVGHVALLSFCEAQAITSPSRCDEATGRERRVKAAAG
jgi:hypothetical protein